MNTEVTKNYVGYRANNVYYTTDIRVRPADMKVGALYSTSSDYRACIVELVQKEPNGILLVQYQSGRKALFGSCSNTKMLSINPNNRDNNWYKAGKEPGEITYIEGYDIYPIKHTLKGLVFGALYADINGKDASIFQYKGITSSGYAIMKVLHNGTDYCANEGETILFPAESNGAWYIVRRNN